jgi:hypothetical protein
MKHKKKQHSLKYTLIANIKTVAAMRFLQPIWSRLLLVASMASALEIQRKARMARSGYTPISIDCFPVSKITLGMKKACCSM